MPDTALQTMSEQLLECLQEQLALKPDPPAQFCLRAGDQVLHDVDAGTGTDTTCCPGLGYVRFGPAFPSSSFPEPDSTGTTRGKCQPLAWAAQLTMGVVRCVPGMGTTAGPDCEDWTSAAVHDFNDFDALRETVCCWSEKIPRTRLWLVQGSDVQMQADCIERTMTVLVAVPRCC